MKFPFAVYTAHHGYAWSRVPDGFTEDSLKEFEQIVTTSKPEYMEEGVRFQGIIYARSHLVVFSAMRVPNWDYSNRTSLYYAFAFVPRAEGGQVNVDRLLDYDCFTVPTKDPESCVDYVDGPSVTVPAEVVAEFRSGAPSIAAPDFSYCGDLIREVGHLADKWWIFRTTGSREDGSRMVFERNAFLFAAPEPGPVRSKPVQGNETKAVVGQVRPKAEEMRSAWLAVVLIVAGAALLCLVLIYTDFAGLGG